MMLINFLLTNEMLSKVWIEDDVVPVWKLLKDLHEIYNKHRDLFHKKLPFQSKWMKVSLCKIS